MHSSVSCCRWDPPVLERFWSPWNAQACSQSFPHWDVQQLQPHPIGWVMRIVSSIGYGSSGLLFILDGCHWYVLETVLSLILWLSSFCYWFETFGLNFLLLSKADEICLPWLSRWHEGSSAVLMHHFRYAHCSISQYKHHLLVILVWELNWHMLFPLVAFRRVRNQWHRVRFIDVVFIK